MFEKTCFSPQSGKKDPSVEFTCPRQLLWVSLSCCCDQRASWVQQKCPSSVLYFIALSTFTFGYYIWCMFTPSFLLYHFLPQFYVLVISNLFVCLCTSRPGMPDLQPGAARAQDIQELRWCLCSLSHRALKHTHTHAQKTIQAKGRKNFDLTIKQKKTFY